MITSTLDKSLFRELLRDRRLTQYKLAEKVGIHEKTFSLHLKNNELTDSQKERVAKVLNVSVERLWPCEDEKSPTVSGEAVDYLKEQVRLHKKIEDQAAEILETNRNLAELTTTVLRGMALLETLYQAFVQHRQITENNPGVLDDMHTYLSENLQRTITTNIRPSTGKIHNDS